MHQATTSTTRNKKNSTVEFATTLGIAQIFVIWPGKIVNQTFQNATQSQNLLLDNHTSTFLQQIAYFRLQGEYNSEARRQRKSCNICSVQRTNVHVEGKHKFQILTHDWAKSNDSYFQYLDNIHSSTDAPEMSGGGVTRNQKDQKCEQQSMSLQTDQTCANKKKKKKK
jgi:hypothetical protein